MTMRAVVSVPAHLSGLRLVGWGGDAAQEEAAATGSRSSSDDVEGALEVLVNVCGRGYAPTRVQALKAAQPAPASNGADAASAGEASTVQLSIEVCVCARVCMCCR